MITTSELLSSFRQTAYRDLGRFHQQKAQHRTLLRGDGVPVVPDSQWHLVLRHLNPSRPLSAETVTRAASCLTHSVILKVIESVTQGAAKRLAFRPITRRKFLGLAAATGVAGVGIDSIAIEPNLPHIVRLEIPLRRWPEHLDGFTIALLSDFHYDPYFSIHPIKSAIGMVNDLKPDVIVLTGDFVSLPLFKEKDKTVADHAEPCGELLKQMHATHGLWAVLGNHDVFSDPDRVTEALRSQGIQVLVNQSAPIETNGARFWLAGVDDVLGEHADLDATLHGIPKDEATVLLAHEPDYADHVMDFPVDLQLSGHTHGGQVRVPLVPVFYLPKLGTKYVKGLFHLGPLTLYTNIGLGTVAFPVRFNCPPEITFITVRKATPK